MLASDNDFGAVLFCSNVADNTFGPAITLASGVFGLANSPPPAIDTLTNQAVVAGGTGAFLTHPTLAIADLATQDIVQFEGLGFGFVNGIAMHSADGIFATTTEDDFSIEFYNLATKTGFKVKFPDATSQSQKWPAYRV